MGYIYIYINIIPKKLQFAAYRQFVLVRCCFADDYNQVKIFIIFYICDLLLPLKKVINN